MCQSYFETWWSNFKLHPNHQTIKWEEAPHDICAVIVETLSINPDAITNQSIAHQIELADRERNLALLGDIKKVRKALRFCLLGTFHWIILRDTLTSSLLHPEAELIENYVMTVAGLERPTISNIESNGNEGKERSLANSK